MRSATTNTKASATSGSDARVNTQRTPTGNGCLIVRSVAS
jgi:hypothetical protein